MLAKIGQKRCSCYFKCISVIYHSNKHYSGKVYYFVRISVILIFINIIPIGEIHTTIKNAWSRMGYERINTVEKAGYP